MPEFIVDPELGRYNQPSGPTRVARGFRSLWDGLQAIEKAKDEAFVDVVKFATNGDVDLSKVIEANDRAKSIAPLAGGALEALLVDTLITSPTGGGSDLPPGVDTSGRPLTAPTVEQLVAAAPTAPQQVVMLPMWNADP